MRLDPTARVRGGDEEGDDDARPWWSTGSTSSLAPWEASFPYMTLRVRQPLADAMTRPDDATNAPSRPDPPSRIPEWLTGILVTQSIALGIALVAPITPSKTGSTWSPANFFSSDPTYLEKVGASFVLVNLLLLALGLAALVVSRWGKSG